jgi:hypothetical protein
MQTCIRALANYLHYLAAYRHFHPVQNDIYILSVPGIHDFRVFTCSISFHIESTAKVDVYTPEQYN